MPDLQSTALVALTSENAPPPTTFRTDTTRTDGTNHGISPGQRCTQSPTDEEDVAAAAGLSCRSQIGAPGSPSVAAVANRSLHSASEHALEEGFGSRVPGRGQSVLGWAGFDDVSRLHIWLHPPPPRSTPGAGANVPSVPALPVLTRWLHIVGSTTGRIRPGCVAARLTGHSR